MEARASSTLGEANPEKAKALRQTPAAQAANRQRARQSLGIVGATGEARYGRCPICPADSPDVALVCDHDHSTGLIRGWICGPCNRALGLLKDCPDRMKKAALYLTGGLK